MLQRTWKAALGKKFPELENCLRRMPRFQGLIDNTPAREACMAALLTWSASCPFPCITETGKYNSLPPSHSFPTQNSLTLPHDSKSKIGCHLFRTLLDDHKLRETLTFHPRPPRLTLQIDFPPQIPLQQNAVAFAPHPHSLSRHPDRVHGDLFTLIPPTPTHVETALGSLLSPPHNPQYLPVTATPTRRPGDKSSRHNSAGRTTESCRGRH